MQLSHLLYMVCMTAITQNIEAVICRQLTFSSQANYGDVFLEASLHNGQPLILREPLWFSEGFCDN